MLTMYCFMLSSPKQLSMDSISLGKPFIAETADTDKKSASSFIFSVFSDD